jgi:hypothetical protein
MGRRHANCHAVSRFYSQTSVRDLGGVGRSSCSIHAALARPHPGRTEAIALAGSERGGKNESLRSAKFPSMNQLLISLPVEQQLLELKPNGSKIGNRGIPTWSARRGVEWEPSESLARLRRDPAVGPAPSRWSRCECAASESVREWSRGRQRPNHQWPTRPQCSSCA